MSTTLSHQHAAERPTATKIESAVEPSWLVFWGWCFRYETAHHLPGRMSFLSLLFVYPFLFEGKWNPSLGHNFVQHLFLTAALIIVLLGASHAAAAITWEMSDDVKGLTRITGLSPTTLLCGKIASKWFSICVGLLLLLPFFWLATWMGGVTTAQITADLAVLTMLFAIVFGFSLVVAVSSTGNGTVASSGATIGVQLLMLLYHCVCWFTAVLIQLAYCVLNNQIEWIPDDSLWMTAVNFVLEFAPATLFFEAMSSPNSFTLWKAGFWFQFAVAALCMRLAIIVIRSRFRSFSFKTSEASVAKQSQPIDRPRCSADPLFWKDSQILTNGTRSRRFWAVSYVVVALAIGVVNAQSTQFPPEVSALLLSSWLALALGLRLDSLIAVEFEEQTWPSLMLLPSSRTHVIRAKVKAVLAEQWPVVIPMIAAVVTAWRTDQTRILKLQLISVISAIVVTELTCLRRLKPGNLLIWGSYPVHVAMLILAGPAVVLSTISLSLCLFIQASMIVVYYSLVCHFAENWTEANLPVGGV